MRDPDQSRMSDLQLELRHFTERAWERVLEVQCPRCKAVEGTVCFDRNSRTMKGHSGRMRKMRSRIMAGF